MVEKGYSPEDYEVRQVNLLEGENFAPTYLRVNSKGTVPTLVVPVADTTGQEVDTKFRALNNSIEITNFLGEFSIAQPINKVQDITKADSTLDADTSRSQSLLDIKGEDNGKPAPVLSPATIEGKAVSDALITVSCVGNSTLLRGC